jgi:chaperonin GroEL
MKTAFNKEAKAKLATGIKKVADAVGSTLGPYGRNVVFIDDYSVVRSTKDGVTVAKTLKDFEDPIENIGAQMIKQASIKTADKAGDGTTTSTVLANALIQKSFNSINPNTNVVLVKKGIEAGAKEVIKGLKEIKREINSEDQIQQVATISANNDEEIGTLVAEAMDMVGQDGVVTVEESKTGETSLETVEGIQFDRGYKSMYFTTDNNTMSAILKDPLILIYNGRLTSVKELLPVLEGTSQTDSSLLIIAEDIDGEALSTLIVNKMRGMLKVAAVKAPDFGDRRLAVLEDIATVTGGTVVSPEKGMKLERFNSEWFGQARVVTVTKDTTTIVDGGGVQDDIQNRVNELKEQIGKATSAFEKEHLQERLGKLVGGVAVINIGGATETEIKEKKDRIDDALQATKAALEEGLLPGGGIALLEARESITQLKEDGDDFNLGKRIAYYACGAPFLKILSNAGIENNEEIIFNLRKAREDNSTEGRTFGYDIKTETVRDMFEAGIIDPMKVARTALENAVSVAGTVLLTECVIYNEPKKDKNGEQLAMGGEV